MNEGNKNGKAQDALDRAVDAALAKYASAEPRVGLEERILANLRTADLPVADRMWWNWRITAALAAVLVVSAALVWRNRPVHPPTAVYPSATNTKPVATELANYKSDSGVREKAVRRRVHHPLQHEMVAANPKLDVFPSPLPLSEQEKILASYVATYPEHAALVAEARMDALRQEAEVRRAIAGERDETQ